MAFNFETLLQQPEGKTPEFKRDLFSSQPLLKTLGVFGNTAGRRLLIGVTDDPLTESAQDLINSLLNGN